MLGTLFVRALNGGIISGWRA